MVEAGGRRLCEGLLDSALCFCAAFKRVRMVMGQWRV